MTEQMSIQDALRGVRPGRMQTAGIMQVIPLLSDLETDAFANPSDILMGTTAYGSMRFRNPTAKLALVPSHAAYVTAHKAQDHAMPAAGLLPAKGTKTFTHAMCIEQRQMGLIPEDRHRLAILPMSLREDALAKRRDSSVGKLWESISRFKRETKVTVNHRSDRGHLIDFFEQFDKQLDQFVAEFELVAGMIGAIVLIGGEVIGVERAPSRAYWEDVWEPLIRTCYGSEAIRRTRMGKAATPRTAQVRAVRDLDDLVTALAEARADDEGSVRDTVREMVQDPFRVAREAELGGYSLETVDNAQFSGQIVRLGPQVHYVSVIERHGFAKHANWHKASPFVI